MLLAMQFLLFSVWQILACPVRHHLFSGPSSPLLREGHSPACSVAFCDDLHWRGRCCHLRFRLPPDGWRPLCQLMSLTPRREPGKQGLCVLVELMSVIRHSFFATFSSLGLNTLIKQPFQVDWETEIAFLPLPRWGLWVLPKAYWSCLICCCRKFGCGFQGYQGKLETVKGGRFWDSSLSQRARKWFSVFSISAEERTAPFHQVSAVLG